MFSFTGWLLRVFWGSWILTLFITYGKIFFFLIQGLEEMSQILQGKTFWTAVELSHPVDWYFFTNWHILCPSTSTSILRKWKTLYFKGNKGESPFSSVYHVFFIKCFQITEFLQKLHRLHILLLIISFFFPLSSWNCIFRIKITLNNSLMGNNMQ